MTLKRIQIQNFQSHENTVFDLHEGINAITGVSDSGKSSVTRAVSWVLTNRPTGNAFTSYWAEKEGTKVSLNFDGINVKRHKSKIKNSYQFGKEQFNVVKTDVPTEVQEFINLDAINIQGQHDRYFLMQDTSGEVARKLNKIANLDIIDFVLSNTDSAIRENNKKIAITEQLIAGFTDDLKKYENLDIVENLLANLTSLCDRIKTNEQTISTLLALTEQIFESQEELRTLNDWLTVESYAKPIFEAINKLSYTQDKLSQLKSIVEYINQLNNKISILQKKIDCEKQVESIIQQEKQLQKTKNDYNNLKYQINTIEDLEINIGRIHEYLKCEPTLNQLQKQYTKYLQTKDKLKQLKILLFGMVKTNKSIGDCTQLINNKTTQAVNLIAQNNICPLCGNTIDESAITHIQRWL